MANILHLIDFCAPYRGNLLESLNYLDTCLKSEGSESVYLFPKISKELDWAKEMQKSGRKLYFIDPSFFSKKIKLKNIRFLTRILKENKISVIHTNFAVYNYTLFITKKFVYRSIKIIGQFQNHYILPDNIIKRFKVFVTSHTYDKIIGVSESVVESILDTSIPGNKVTCIFNSLAPSRLNISENVQLRSRTGQKVILMFGWPYYRKGVDIAIDAIMQMNSDGSDLMLAISLAGGKNIIENEIKKKLGTIPDWIKILDPREDIATYYHASDLFISPSREEGYTFAVLEAAYCGCMIAVSSIGGNPKDIPYTEIFESENSGKMKDCIMRILNWDELEINKIRKVQREYVLMHYSIKDWADSILNIYKLVSSNGN